MRKEVVLAIVIGVGLGLVLTFGVWTANKALKEKKVITETVSPAPQVAGTETIESIDGNISLVSPDEGDLFSEDSILVTGKTWTKSNLVVLTEKGEVVGKAGETGDFEIPVKLAAGTNTIRVFAFDETGEKKAGAEVNVVFSSQFE